MTPDMRYPHTYIGAMSNRTNYFQESHIHEPPDRIEIISKADEIDLYYLEITIG
jgi:hypothetical protein